MANLNFPEVKDRDPNAEVDMEVLNDTIEYIRPAVQADGGDIKLASVKNGVVNIEMLGACQGCPMSIATLKSGIERILKDKIKNGTDDEIDISKKDLILLYDQWLEYFPKKRGKKVSGDILSNKAQSMLDYKIANKEEIYKIFDEAYRRDAASFTNPKELYNYFKTYYQLYKDGVDGVTMEKLFTKYEEVSEKFEVESTNLSKKLDLILKKHQKQSSFLQMVNILLLH